MKIKKKSILQQPNPIQNSGLPTQILLLQQIGHQIKVYLEIPQMLVLQLVMKKQSMMC